MGRPVIKQDDLMARFCLTHGEKYDYSKVHYVGNHVKVIIICPTHGEFQQVPADHLTTLKVAAQHAFELNNQKNMEEE